MCTAFVAQYQAAYIMSFTVNDAKASALNCSGGVTPANYQAMLYALGGMNVTCVETAPTPAAAPTPPVQPPTPSGGSSGEVSTCSAPTGPDPVSECTAQPGL